MKDKDKNIIVIIGVIIVILLVTVKICLAKPKIKVKKKTINSNGATFIIKVPFGKKYSYGRNHWSISKYINNRWVKLSCNNSISSSNDEINIDKDKEYSVNWASYSGCTSLESGKYRLNLTLTDRNTKKEYTLNALFTIK